VRDLTSQFAYLLDSSSEYKIDYDTETNEYDEIDNKYCQDTRHYACGELDNRSQGNGQERCDG